jgi:NAD(P)-dependent dehydrogenase (short-subunit alcohol dehydrogenase family)
MIMRCFVYANSLGVQPGTRHEGRIEIDCSNLGSELSGPENSRQPAHPWDDRPDARAVKSGFAKLAPLGRLAHPAEIASAALLLASDGLERIIPEFGDRASKSH